MTQGLSLLNTQLNLGASVKELLEVCAKVEESCQQAGAAFESESPVFWTAYLLLLYMERRVVDAVHLWRRMASGVNGVLVVGQYAPLVIAIGAALRDKAYPKVIATLSMATLDSILVLFKDQLLVNCRVDYLDLVSRAYSSIQLNELSTKLGVQPEEAASLCRDRAWNIDHSSGMVFPSERLATSTGGLEAPTSLSASDGIQALTQSILYFERAAVDVSVK
jgi:hypothetical protein